MWYNLSTLRNESMQTGFQHTEKYLETARLDRIYSVMIKNGLHLESIFVVRLPKRTTK
jgi:hypothetical protein